MKLVIDIPETIWVAIQNGEYCGILDDRTYNAIKNGTPLPEKHGRLIDLDELFKKLNSEKIPVVEDINYILRHAPVIIEASDPEATNESKYKTFEKIQEKN